MNNQWLTQLAPEYAPAAPRWWPPAPGWWIVVVLLLMFCAVSIWWWRYSVRASQRRQQRIALRELRRIRDSASDIGTVARAIENLLRRYALTVFGRDSVAQLSGAAWLNFVATHGGELSGDTGHALLAAAFGNAIDDRREQWLVAAESFIQRAKRPAPRREVIS